VRTKRYFLLFFLSLFLFTSGLYPEIEYPWKNIYIGALEARALNGLVLSPQENSVFAFRFRVEKEGEIVDGNDVLYLISEVGPHSPDGQYARLKLDLSLPFNMRDETPILIKPPSSADTFIFEWSRQDERTVVGRIRVPGGMIIHLVHYFPWDIGGKYSVLSDGHVKGENTGFSDFQYLLWTDPKGNGTTESEGEEVVISFPTEDDQYIYFVAGLGEEEDAISDQINRLKNRRTIDSILEEEERRYMNRRVKVEGLYGGAARAISNNLFWTTLYQPGHNRIYVPLGRNRILPTPEGNPGHWTIFEWGSFFNALEASIESSKHAKDIIKAVLETQYPNGNIPNWRGRFGGTPDRSQPPIGSYVVYKLFQRLGDVDLLSYAYPYLVRWHTFWKEENANGQSRRDGNGDGLLEWGTDPEYLPQIVPSWQENAEGKKRATWESGEDDLPNWDEASFNQETGTLTVNSVSLNSLYTLDAWCLAQIADILDRREEYEHYLSEYEEMKDLINTALWDDKEGFYFDRHWDGRFSSKKAASNFYPLLARIPDRTMALQMNKHLLNPKEFWGDFVIPTISRDDPAFNRDHFSWRGAIWSPTNYLVYQGLKANRFDAVASEFAKRSYELFLRTWENYQLCPESFDARTGAARGHEFLSWGPLFTLMALEEYLDFTPWEGFRFGMINPEEKGKLSRMSILGRHYEVDVSRALLRLKEEDREILRTNGSAVFRRFLYSENEISFEIHAIERRDIRVQFLVEGKYQVLVDDEVVSLPKGRSCRIRVPEGYHFVLIQLLERMD
jgi:hypothetical protein